MKQCDADCRGRVVNFTRVGFGGRDVDPGRCEVGRGGGQECVANRNEVMWPAEDRWIEGKAVYGAKSARIAALLVFTTEEGEDGPVT